MDFNGDKVMDILTIGYGGVPYIYYGKKNGEYEKIYRVVDKKGEIVSGGKCVTHDPYGMKEFEGYENSDRMESIKAVDWDKDGDLDLIMGGYLGLKLRINEGTKKNPVFATENIILTEEYHIGDIADWNGDGLWDIIVWSVEKGVMWMENIGKKKKPQFASAKTLLSLEKIVSADEDGEGVNLLAPRIVDYNNDGKLDIILGAAIKTAVLAPDCTEEQLERKQELIKMIRANQAEVKSRTEALYEEHGGRDQAVKYIHKDKRLTELDEEMKKIVPEWIFYVPKARTYGYTLVSLRQ